MFKIADDQLTQSDLLPFDDRSLSHSPPTKITHTQSGWKTEIYKLKHHNRCSTLHLFHLCGGVYLKRSLEKRVVSCSAYCECEMLLRLFLSGTCCRKVLFRGRFASPPLGCGVVVSIPARCSSTRVMTSSALEDYYPEVCHF